MRMSLQTKYFLVLIIVIGSIGIWLPFVLAIPLDKTVEPSSIPINLTTFYVSIYFAGCVDLILKHIDSDDKWKTKSRVLNMIILILLVVALIITTVWLSISGHIFLPTLIALTGSVIALRLWWISNRDNPTFNEQVRNEAKFKHAKKWNN